MQTPIMSRRMMMKAATPPAYTPTEMPPLVLSFVILRASQRVPVNSS
jgi:hypothetical protein